MANFVCEKFDDQGLSEQDNDISGPSKIMIITVRDNVLDQYKLSKPMFDHIRYAKGGLDYKQSEVISGLDTKLCP